MNKPEMHPWPGERLLRFVGDTVRFTLSGPGGGPLPQGFRAVLRTNLGRASTLHEEIVYSHARELPFAGASWRDTPLKQTAREWSIDLSLVEVGFFKAKAYAVDSHGRQYWPDGPDVGISVHPNDYRTANTIYCAFTRLFGGTKKATTTQTGASDAQLGRLDKEGYAVIPPSGKLRDLLRELPHIMGTLGCRILHLLPINPVPTTFARMGRFGSPYAALDLTAIDPALVEFDRRTTGVDQFRELSYAAHVRGGRVFLDLVMNHTGWGSSLQENCPEWFLRDERGNFVNPGAWGTTWEDLVELDHRTPAPWESLAGVFLTWCRRGVDGFRCDAGYKVPVAAWRYIIARVRQEFPQTVFLLEGLGGPWETTESLLTEGGMQWAYSELFQNYSGEQVAGYLDYAARQSQRVGTYIHYSETHDNDRLAKRGRAWSLLRNRLCGLTSFSGGFGFACGVEWLAAEKIDVHGCSGLSFGSPKNLVRELGHLNELLRDHPCFFDDARVIRLSPVNSPVLALRRDSAGGADRVLILANLDVERTQTGSFGEAAYRDLGEPRHDLLGQSTLVTKPGRGGSVEFVLPPAGCYCLSAHARPVGLAGDSYRRARAAAAWGFTALSHVFAIEKTGRYPWRAVAELVNKSPDGFLAALPHLNADRAGKDLAGAFAEVAGQSQYPRVVIWTLLDRRRITVVPPGHWLLVRDEAPFRAMLSIESADFPNHTEAIRTQGGYVAFFAPRKIAADAQLKLERNAEADQRLEASIRFLASDPNELLAVAQKPKRTPGSRANLPDGRQITLEQLSRLVLLTNGIGGMARLGVDLGRIQSKYDCLLGANLHPAVPTDRHVFAKRARAWVNADGFITALDMNNLIEFSPGPPSHWRFLANAGDGRTVEIHLEAAMLENRNTTVLRFSRPVTPPKAGRDLPAQCDVRLTVRIDIEDRNFHWETKRNGGAEQHFSSHCRPLEGNAGFEFSPAPDRRLRVFVASPPASPSEGGEPRTAQPTKGPLPGGAGVGQLKENGSYHHEAEWCENIPHPVEQSRGQTVSGDTYSPGWFELPLAKGENLILVATADSAEPDANEVNQFAANCQAKLESALALASIQAKDEFGRQLVRAAHAFVVRRGSGKTVIAGYPWFLDWGRDSLICARGLLAAGMREDVKQLLVTFGRFEANGTLPNSIHGEDASNRDTSDAPLWFGVVCEEAAALFNDALYEVVVDKRGRTVADVLAGIAAGYLRGTPNGIRVDPQSGLVWSPKHFTWMDTNHPAGTPRAGYPVEIQVLWIRLLKQLSRLDAKPRKQPWGEIADRTQASFLKHFWLEERGYFSDLLIAPGGEPSARARADNALRSNCLFAISLGLSAGAQARRCVDAAARYLVVPGALRSLAPLPVSPPLPVHGNDGRLLNDPDWPYWGRYEGDEDTRRKPAYHNGTAWTWTFPTFCEALAQAWDFQPPAVAAAKAYLGSMERILREGCLGQIPEILDGDATHQQRGCDAQAWGVTEALRVWKLLDGAVPKPH
ncbi:MAG: glycogen debranching enzyme N-terminal domain-containing protein [Verrucomicrobia bacterium]|nr:glycogen debranching enzyme N-terminal domain-containing protein [Verrucomicrobiota bacterium]